MKVVVTGPTGFIGSALVEYLRAGGHEVVPISHRTVDLESPSALAPLIEGSDAVIHLAGEPIAAKRWDARQKQRIRDSRIETTRAIVEAIASAEHRPRVLVTASGVDIYPYATGPMDDDEVTETDPAADTFLGRVCRDWEAEAGAAEALGVRVVSMRTGLVLGPGGALARLATLFKLFAGGRIGSGHQWVSWIHRDDVVAAYTAALIDDRYRGPINLVTASIRNADFSKAIGRSLHRPSWLPVPGFAVKLALGELAEPLLEGRMVVPAKLRALGFTWSRPTLEAALATAA